MTMLIVRHYLPEGIKPTLYEATIPNELCEEYWMGTYLNGEKIGYSHRKITELNNGYRISEILKVRLKMMGIEKDIFTNMDAEIDRQFRLLSFVFRLRSDINTEIKGRVEGKNLLVSINTGGLTSSQTIPLREPPYLNLSVVPDILKKRLKSGHKVSIPVIDPSTLSQDNMNIEVIGKDSIMSMGKRQDTYKIKIIFKGVETFTWLTEKGEVLREESPMGFTLVKETKESAIQPGKPSIDLIAQAAITFNIKLPPDTIYLKVRLSGVDLKSIELDGGRQTLKGDILEIRKESLDDENRVSPPARGGADDSTPHRGSDIPKAFGTDLSQRGFPDEYLKETMFIQSKDPAVVSLTKDIIGDEKDRLKLTRLIYEWVYKNIKKVQTISLPMATEVLRMGQGDCNEHATLFTALARAAGIPARIAVGLTYKDGFFYYHAWPEVYLNEWVAVDPTLGQFPADAAHIRLLTGDIDKQLHLLTIIGKLRLEGIEYH
ncbi:MAG: transglutaminase-like domain-containing protein [Nitrospirota bacterium]